MCGALQSGPQFLTSQEFDETILLELHPMNFSNTYSIAYHRCCPSLAYSQSLERLRPTCVGACLNLTLHSWGRGASDGVLANKCCCFMYGSIFYQ